MRLFILIVVLSIIGFGTSSAYFTSDRQQSSHHSESSYSSGSSHNSGHAYSYKSQSAQGPGYSYSYSYSDGGSPLLLPGYAAGYHTFSPLIIPPIDFDVDLDFDLDDDLDFDIDTDLDLDIDLDFPGIEYGLGYIGKYGHWYRKPRYGFSKLYNSINGDIWNYGGRYGYDHLGPLNFGSLNFFK